ncbi:MAG: sigma-54-dependent Fis family transcriptional regulator [Rubrivivax sp.]|nr:sigma-54-dependent Fis family transcriptional regulator [Rubrivivax sp.]
MNTVLVIDDNAGVTAALALLFSLHDIHTLSAASPADGLALLDGHTVDLVIQDMNFQRDTTSGDEGRALFAAIRARHPDLPVVLLTAWTDLAAAVALVKAGAADYLGKPWDDAKLLATVKNLLELGAATRQLQQQARARRRRLDELQSRYRLEGLVFADAATERVVALACQVARADVPVLITGPSGAGKERIAAIVQANSAVRDGPFVTLNCGALPAELVEAELFGAEAGAYTGAAKARAGRFEAADGGTLFLDEIGNLPLSGQMKLLRVLETGRFVRLGATQEQQVQVRVISATNADLPAMIAEGRFREDLYYRLNLIELRLPPLRERPDDIGPLARAFLGPDHHLTDDAADALQRHDWPGNVRELKNTMQRVALLQPAGHISALQLALPARRMAPAFAPLRAGDEPDRASIIAALARADGVVAQAAAELGLSRQALYRRLERFGIGRPA